MYISTGVVLILVHNLHNLHNYYYYDCIMFKNKVLMVFNNYYTDINVGLYRCSDYQKEVERLRINKRVRVCKDCYDKHKL